MVVGETQVGIAKFISSDHGIQRQITFVEDDDGGNGTIAAVIDYGCGAQHTGTALGTLT